MSANREFSSPLKEEIKAMLEARYPGSTYLGCTEEFDSAVGYTGKYCVELRLADGSLIGVPMGFITKEISPK